MNETQLQELEKTLREDLAAIERVRALLGKKGSRQVVSAPNGIHPTVFGRGELIGKVREHVNGINGRFTIKDVFDAFEKNGMPLKAGSLQTALARMVEDGVIEVVTKGGGRRPTIYRKGKDTEE